MALFVGCYRIIADFRQDLAGISAHAYQTQRQEEINRLDNEDGRIRRTGTMWTASAHIITAAIGFSVLSLVWDIAQLGWIGGPIVVILLSMVILYTSFLLVNCCGTGDAITGRRNYTYSDAIHSNLAAVMSFIYSFIGLALSIIQVVGNGRFKGSLTGISIGSITQTQKIWRILRSFKDIAFAYSHPIILVEIQATINALPLSEAKVMKKATFFSVAVITFFYIVCGCMGYAAFGDSMPGNLLAGFGFYNPYWLLDIANAAIVIHLIGAYQVFCHQLFAFIEKWVNGAWPNSTFISTEIRIPLSSTMSLKLSLFRLVWRSAFVVATTVISLFLPYSSEVIALPGALGIWLFTVNLPIEMYIAKKKVPKWSLRWACLQMLCLACRVISLASFVGSIAHVVSDLKVYRSFKSESGS
ncbi:hypothetical protein IEQ34_026310 [Dendrobium chrysotoxum]|uniref:Amino acid transporter transmembrane domain-containing protein n=1 Tax=Dendrobium chrysotoxum TaxID=161865 RepID=A0AAV7FM68_DENCH|nr:hypothetical protein IEQ34_026310 [Dendrobium chrysotoxum]